MEKRKVNVRCKSGSDLRGIAKSCSGFLAYVSSDPGSHITRFECEKCGYVWVINVGGSVTL